MSHCAQPEVFKKMPLSSILSDEKSAVNIIGNPLFAVSHLQFAAFKILSVFGFREFYYDIPWSTYLQIIVLGFIEPLGCVDYWDLF